MKNFLTPLLLFLGAFAVSWIYQTPPSLGDDLNYWGLAFDLHHGVEGAWSATSFHDLRWPVWGICWLLQIPFGYSALSYYLEPMVYLGAGAVIVWLLALEIGATSRTAIVAGILFLFHPQLDSVIDRPMPDLSEGFWVAVAFLAWLKMMRSDRRGIKIALAAAVGLALAIGQANRITGVFAIPVLFLATLAFYPRQFLWLVLCGAFAAGFVAIESAIYYSITGDPFHSLTANKSATGRKGTETIPLWELPFRFLPTLLRRHTDIIFNLLALLGIGVAWTRFGAAGRALALYAVGYLLTYSCALQSLFPPRPLVRDGDRFLGSLAFPLAVLTAFGAAWIATHLPSQLSETRAVAFLRKYFPATLLALILLLVLISSRGFREPNYLHEIADYLRAAPSGLKVLSHDAMRHVANLADPHAASRIQWILKKDLLDPSPTTIALANSSDEIWFNRKWIWTGTRKKSEYDKLDSIGDIAPWLRPPLDGWAARRAIAKGDVPDFVFLGRSTTPLAETSSDHKLFRPLLLPPFPVPHTWTLKKGSHEQIVLPAQPIPWDLAGRTFFLSLRYSSDTTEPIRAYVTFLSEDRELQTLVFKPYFFDESSEDFFFVTIPREATAMQVRLRISEKATRINLERFQLLTDEQTR
ncbi:MAG: hypothetical protein ACREKL_11865 [Chthoniobacterales bacterium]